MEQKRQGIHKYNSLKQKGFLAFSKKVTKRRKAQQGAGYTLLSFQTHSSTHSHASDGVGAHCLLEATHSGDIKTAAIV